MLTFLLRRMMSTVFLMVGVTVVTFTLARILPGDPARLIAGARASPEAVAAVRESLNMDGSVVEQFATYVSGALEGDFGRSIVTRRPITEDILTFFPATLELVLVASLLSVVLGVVLGSMAAIYRSGPSDVAVRGCAVLGLSVPDFWIALLAQLVFFSILGIAPFGGRLETGVAAPLALTGMITLDSLIAGRLDLFLSALHHLMLPASVLAIPSTAIFIRVVRASMLDVLSADYLRTARAKGLSPFRIYTRHALRSTLLPIVTVFGLNLGLLISGAVFIELIFDWPGLGRYTANAIGASDYNAIMAITLVVALAYTAINFLVDLSYAFLDPRVELS